MHFYLTSGMFEKVKKKENIKHTQGSAKSTNSIPITNYNNIYSFYVNFKQCN